MLNRVRVRVKEILDAKQTTKAFKSNIYKLYGLPYDIYIGGSSHLQEPFGKNIWIY